MKIYSFILAAVLSVLLIGCATSAKQAKPEETKPAETTAAETPKPAEGEVAVFGKIRLVERINRIPMPTKEQDGSVYVRQEGSDKTIKMRCSRGGDFGVYLAPGDYRLKLIRVGGYRFAPDFLTFTVPADKKAAYMGAVVIDGTPSGVDPATGDTVFVYTVKDEFRDFKEALKQASSSGYVEPVAKSLFKPSGGTAVGGYPKKVFRAKDVKDSLQARTDTVEEVVAGTLVTIPYIINPIWILSAH